MEKKKEYAQNKHIKTEMFTRQNIDKATYVRFV